MASLPSYVLTSLILDVNRELKAELVAENNFRICLEIHFSGCTQSLPIVSTPCIMSNFDKYTLFYPQYRQSAKDKMDGGSTWQGFAKT
jgi:hypothetical protein